MLTMLGCLSSAEIRASLSSISMKLGWRASSSWIFLTTTSFSKPIGPRWRARNTSAMPPAPMRWMRS